MHRPVIQVLNHGAMFFVWESLCVSFYPAFIASSLMPAISRPMEGVL